MSVISASVRPVNVSPGGLLSANVSSTGVIGRIVLYLGSGSPTGPPPSAVDLVEDSPGSWSTSFRAPAVPGMYHYAAGVFVHGHRRMFDNDGWNIVVVGAPATSTPAVAPLVFPADIPLAPPFNYGNAVPVFFTAEGHSMHGLEVISNNRPDVPAAGIAQFYENRLPRAGWTVDPSTAPAQSATSFAIAATSPGGSEQRVVLVEYSAGTVRIFYGTYGA